MSVGIIFIAVFVFIIVRFILGDHTQGNRQKKYSHRDGASSSFIIGSDNLQHSGHDRGGWDDGDSGDHGCSDSGSDSSGGDCGGGDGGGGGGD